jgi:hypothetical protein
MLSVCRRRRIFPTYRKSARRQKRCGGAQKPIGKLFAVNFFKKEI